jgi:light-harvesting complex 1 beta chain
LSTCLRLPWRSWLPGAEGNSSLLRDIRSAVYTLMSHLT